MKYLETKNITKSFDGKEIIRDISIYLEKGEIVSLLGVSGSGKTTLFNIISGLSAADSGEVFLEGESIIQKPGVVSYMLQKDLLLPYYSILENVSLPLVIKGKLSKKEAKEKASALFSQFGLEGTENKFPHQLSGGMRQRAAFLRTYLASDKVALLDEPFSALDTITKNAVHRWYLDIMEKIRLSTLFVTHDIDEAILLSDRIYILSGNPGRISHEITVKAKKPRSDDFVVSEEFISYKKQIFEALKG
ncbi:MAG: ABC transporter ATP-binding protein [Clostridia bacterium]|nr:ABC transporter ATP-binding protein [Clostridia bacterium]